MNDIHFENHVVVHEVRQGTLVGHDATHLGSCQEDIFRSFCLKESLHLVLAGEVQFLVGTGNDVRVALALEFTHDGASHHAPVAGYVDFAVLFHYI